VLPFENIGGDTANAYFAQGMSDEITTELARAPGLTVASRSAVARLKETDPAKIGQALDVGGVIDGTVRRFGDRLKLTAQLTDAATGKILWADSYEQQAKDVFAVEDSVAKSVVAALRLRLNSDNDKAASVTNVQGTTDLAAYDLFLRAQYQMSHRGTYLYNALKLFEQATEKDPKFARAYAGYAMAASLTPEYTKTPSDSIVPLGAQAAKRAIELDPNLADAHLALANLSIFEFKWADAQREYKKALEIDPKNAQAYQWSADVYYLTGKPREAVPYMRRALELDPSAAIIHTDMSYVLLTLTSWTRRAQKSTNPSSSTTPCRSPKEILPRSCINKASMTLCRRWTTGKLDPGLRSSAFPRS
jgi:Predicted integral membrane protein